MGWIGIGSQTESLFQASGLAMPNRPIADTVLLGRGTLVLEGTFLPGPVPQNLLRYATRDPWVAGLSLVLDVDGTLRLLMRQAERTLSVSVATGLTDTPETLTISWCWDGPARHGTLSVWLPDRGALYQAQAVAPLPLTLRDARRLIEDRDKTRLSDQVAYIALSDRMEPAGPMPGLAPSSTVTCPEGDRRIDSLRPGDLVLTDDNDIAQVRWSGTVTRPARGRHAPLLIRAPYHGLHRDLVVSPDQRLAVTGSEIEYLFGVESVAVAARHLTGRNSTRAVANPGPLVSYAQILLDRHGVIRVNGAPVESLDASPVLADPALLPASVLRGLPPELRPSGLTPAMTILQNYETVTLQTIALG